MRVNEIAPKFGAMLDVCDTTMVYLCGARTTGLRWDGPLRTNMARNAHGVPGKGREAGRLYPKPYSAQIWLNCTLFGGGKRMPKTVETDPITEAVTELIASIPVEHLEDKPVMQALLNWFRSQDVEQEDMCVAIATLLGLFIGMRAESKTHLKAGLATYARQLRSAAAVSMEAKQVMS